MVVLLLFLLFFGASTLFTLQYLNVLVKIHAEYMKGLSNEDLKKNNATLKVGLILSTIGWTTTVGILMLMLGVGS